MKKLTILLVLLVSFSFVSKAQMDFGVKAGLNMATISGDNTDNAKMKPSYQIGGVANFNLGDAFSIQPGLILSGKGAQNSEIDDFSINTNYLEIPINAVYNVSGFQVIAGPYLGFGMFGKVKGPDDEVDIAFESDVDTENADPEKWYYNSIDYGVNLGAGYMVNESIQIQALYGLGLANINPKYDGEDPSSEANNSVIQLNVSYFF